MALHSGISLGMHRAGAYVSAGVSNPVSGVQTLVSCM